MNLSRIDVAGASLNPADITGTVSLIQDVGIGVVYTIYTQYSNCSVQALTSSNDIDIYLGHVRSLNDLFLLSAVEYDYTGNMSAHGVLLDNWVFSGDFSHAGYDYTNTTLQWLITQPGQNISSLFSVTSSAVPWRLSIEGLLTSSEGETALNVSSVIRYFDLLFEEPNFDMFDVSVCVDPVDSMFITLALPGARNGIDLCQFKGNIRNAVSNYTQLYPIQVGNIEVRRVYF